MSITPLNPHYAFESLPSVYDEEAMTALEMCGRLGKKVNEIIIDVNDIKMNGGGGDGQQTVKLSPSGDMSGEIDRIIIQEKLDSGYSVHLSAGEYYLNAPLLFRAGYMLRGDSQLNTVLNCKAGFIDHENAVSVDHVEVRDIRVKGPETGIGIDISRKIEGLETGGRYSHFMNVYITGYETAVRLGGCWCTNFTHCRIEASKLCVEQRGSCNNIKYDHCMFLGPVNEKTSTAVKITADDGAENYGITFAHCDFERHDKAIHAYYCVALNVHSVYAEGVKTVFHLDSCPAFMCDGGYISYPDRVCNTSKSNTANVFSKCSGTIRSLYVRVNVSGEPFYLVSSASAFPVKVEDINCVNDGEGECIVNAQQVNGLFNGHEQASVTLFCNTDGNLKSTYALPSNAIPISLLKHQQVKLQECWFQLASSFVATASAKIEIKVKGTHIGLGVSSDVTIFEAYINSGETYSGRISFTPTTEYRNLVLKINNNFLQDITINSSATFYGGDVKGKFYLKYVSDYIIM